MTDTAHQRREPATVRVAMWSSRHRWPVAAAWFLGTIAVFVLSALSGGIRAEDANGSPNQAQTESAKALALFDQGGTGTPTEDVLLVVTHPTLKVTDPDFQQSITTGTNTPNLFQYRVTKVRDLLCPFGGNE